MYQNSYLNHDHISFFKNTFFSIRGEEVFLKFVSAMQCVQLQRAVGEIKKYRKVCQQPGSLEILRGNKKSFGLSVFTFFFDARTGKDICVNRYETIFSMNQTIFHPLKESISSNPRYHKEAFILPTLKEHFDYSIWH